MADDLKDETQRQVLDKTKAGRRLDRQAREKIAESDSKRRDFASGRKRYTEGK
ncbi:MAG TPA: hypothetical protein VFW28_12730 [Micropepsaceae bacterium]|nr:hypothetical protein [Micropepsaceae bacterium]